VEAGGGVGGAGGGGKGGAGVLHQLNDTLLGDRLETLADFEGDWFIPFRKIQLQEIIGMGAAGQVFRARYDGIAVAAKRVPLPMMHTDGETRYLDEVKREAQVVAKMHHPNILEFHGVALSANMMELFLVTELMAFSLDEVVFSRKARFVALRGEGGGGGGGGEGRDGGRDAGAAGTRQAAGMSPALRRQVLLQIVYGLEYLHTRGVIHRDLKPANVLCSEALDRVKVSDFGTSTKLFNMSGSPSAAHQHQHHMTTNLGTPAYMAPELVSDGRVVVADGAAARQVDVYSFAILLYTFTTGLKPYADLKTVNMFTMMNAITDGLRPTLPPAYPATLRDLLVRTWASDPLDRPTCPELIAVLEGEEVLEALGQLGRGGLHRDAEAEREVEAEAEKLLAAPAMAAAMTVRNGQFADGTEGEGEGGGAPPGSCRGSGTSGELELRAFAFDEQLASLGVNSLDDEEPEPEYDGDGDGASPSAMALSLSLSLSPSLSPSLSSPASLSSSPASRPSCALQPFGLGSSDVDTESYCNSNSSSDRYLELSLSDDRDGVGVGSEGGAGGGNGWGDDERREGHAGSSLRSASASGRQLGKHNSGSGNCSSSSSSSSSHNHALGVSNSGLKGGQGQAHGSRVSVLSISEQRPIHSSNSI
jgi:serine/threonine protein kinase